MQIIALETAAVKTHGLKAWEWKIRGCMKDISVGNNAIRKSRDEANKNNK